MLITLPSVLIPVTTTLIGISYTPPSRVIISLIAYPDPYPPPNEISWSNRAFTRHVPKACWIAFPGKVTFGIIPEKDPPSIIVTVLKLYVEVFLFNASDNSGERTPPKLL